MKKIFLIILIVVLFASSYLLWKRFQFSDSNIPNSHPGLSIKPGPSE